MDNIWIVVVIGYVVAYFLRAGGKGGKKKRQPQSRRDGRSAEQTFPPAAGGGGRPEPQQTISDLARQWELERQAQAQSQARPQAPRPPKPPKPPKPDPGRQQARPAAVKAGQPQAGGGGGRQGGTRRGEGATRPVARPYDLAGDARKPAGWGGVPLAEAMLWSQILAQPRGRYPYTGGGPARAILSARVRGGMSRGAGRMVGADAGVGGEAGMRRGELN
jgi:hypothetical protein